MSETLDLLEEVLDENELAALIEKASASKDPEAVYREAYDKLGEDTAPKEVDTLPEEMEKRSISVEQITRIEVNQDTGEEEIKLEGYDIRIVRGSSVLWMGKTMSPGPRYNSIPFSSVDEAHDTVRIWIRTQEENKPQYPRAVWRTVRIPVSVGEEMPKSGTTTSVRFSAEETRILNAVVRGMRAENLEIDTNKPVDGFNKAFRYILNELSKAM